MRLFSPLWHPALLYLLMAYCHRWRRRRNGSFGKMSLRWFKNSSSPPQGHTICATLSTCSTADYFPRCSRRKKTRTYFVRWPAAENSKTKKMKLLHYDSSFKILEWDVTPPPLPFERAKNKWWFISHYDLRMQSPPPPSKVLPQPQQQQPGSLVDLRAYGRR